MSVEAKNPISFTEFEEITKKLRSKKTTAKQRLELLEIIEEQIEN